MRLDFFLLEMVACKKVAIQVLCMQTWNDKKKTEGGNGCLLMFCCRFNDSCFVLSLALYFISSQNTFSHGISDALALLLDQKNLLLNHTITLLTPRFLHSPTLPLDDFSFGGMHSSSSRLGPSRFSPSPQQMVGF